MVFDMDDVNITNGKHEFLDPAATMMTPCFTTDPAMKALLSALPEKERSEFIYTYLRCLFKAAVLNHGTIQNVNDWECCAIWMPPETRIDNYFTLFQSGLLGVFSKLGVAGFRQARHYAEQADGYKRESLKGIKRYHYLFFIGTAAEARGKGFASKVIRRYQAKCEEEGLPLWLEATTVHSRDVYARCGFEIVGEIVVGKGEHDSEGNPQKGGPGVIIWAMLWKPTNISAEAKTSSGSMVSTMLAKVRAIF